MSYHGIDEDISIWLRYIWGFMVQWSLIAWHFTTDTWDKGCEWSIKTIRGIQEAHQEDVWVFIDRNSTPLLLKDKDVTEHYNNSLLFYPKSNTFLLHNRLTDNRSSSFDCVDVSYNSNNLTSFFMNLRWKQGAAPSLVECVMLFWILNKAPLPRSEINTIQLVVLDSDAAEHTINLGSEQGKRRFTAWV
jgi:hypothetical protein